MVIDYYDCDTASIATCLNAGPTWTTNGTVLSIGLNVAANTTANGIKITTALNVYEIEFTPKNNLVANHLLTKIITYEQEALEESYVCSVGNEVTNTGTCSPCQTNNYAELGAKTCTLCPDQATTSGTGTSQDELGDCACPAGTFATASGCTPCQQNTFNAEGDTVNTTTLSQCTLCPDQATTSGTGTSQDELGDCACPVGTFANSTGCTHCPQNTYNVNEDLVGTPTECDACPNDSTSGGGSNELSDCACPAGTFATASGCTPCQQNTFNAEGDTVNTTTLSQCTLCPDQATTSGTGTSQDELGDCACPAGTFATASGCTPCQQNTFNAEGDTVNTTTLSQCTLCPDQATTSGTGTSQDELGDCACPVGTFANSTGCTHCPQNTYNVNEDLVGTPTECDACPNDSTSGGGSNELSDCACPAGTFATASGCTPCQQNTFNAEGDTVNTTTLSQCTLCPDQATTSGTGTSQDELGDCACPAGTFANSTGCTPCPQNTYNVNEDLVGTPTECDACPNDSTSGGGSNELSDCACPVGTFANSTGCTHCPQNTYNVNEDLVGTPTECDACPNDSTSGGGSNELSDCQCPAGTFATASGCTPCQQNTFNAEGDTVNTTTLSQCTLCPDQATSNGGSDELGDCQCLAGTSATASGCVDCADHSFNPAGDTVNTTTPSQCTGCPDNSTTYGDGEFQDHISDCQCLTGTSATGSGCAHCPPGTFNNNTDPASPATTCDNCVSGKYAAYFGQYLCTECADCVAGEERLNCGGSSPGECSKCVPGKYDVGGNICEICPAGSITDTGVASGAVNCTQCPDDTYSTQSNVTTCTACVTGKVSSTGSDEESDCLWSSIMYGYVKLYRIIIVCGYMH